MADINKAQLQQAIQSDPDIQAYLAQMQKSGVLKSNFGASKSGTTPQMSQALSGLRTLLEQKGIQLPKDSYVDPKTGQVEKEGWFFRNSDWLVPTILGVATLGTSLIPSAAAAGGGTAAATGGGAAAAGGGAAAGGTAAATGTAVAAASPWSTFLKAALPSVISAGAQLGGAAIQTKGLTDAAKIAADTADKDRARAKEIFDLEYSDLAPYRNLGAGSIGALSQGLGLPAPPAAAPTAGPTPAPQSLSALAQPTAPPAGMAPNAQPTQPGYTAMLTPDGRSIQVPPNQVQEALSRGAKTVTA